MSEKMHFIDREMLVAATLAAACPGNTNAEQAVANFRSVLFEIAVAGGLDKIRNDAKEIAEERRRFVESGQTRNW